MTSDSPADRSFYGSVDPTELTRIYGSPVYVYQEALFRRRCAEMQGLLDRQGFTCNYSLKANSNLTLLRIARQIGLHADAMSPGEIMLLKEAGFTADQILFVPNNVSAEEMCFALDRGILISADSLDQLDLIGRLSDGGEVALRLNAGVGAGHSDKVITAGDRTKFGVNAGQIDAALRLAADHGLRIVGVNQHIGSLFMEPAPYLNAAEALFSLAMRFPDLRFVDLGGGFGIPYRKLTGQTRLDLDDLRAGLEPIVHKFRTRYGNPILIKAEPGRYPVAECGVLLGTVWAIKENAGVCYAGTDIGFNVLARPMLYDAWHDLVIFRDGQRLPQGEDDPLYTVVGNICESGDILASGRRLPELRRGDTVAVLDAGAYGYAMSSGYNSRLRPAEVLIDRDGNHRLIRRRETYADLLAAFTD